MPVDTRTAEGRRDLTFASLEEVVVDAERLVASPVITMLGNRPLSQLLTHLAVSINSSIDGYSVTAPWFAQLLGPLIKQRFLTKRMPAGVTLPEKEEAVLYPATASPQQSLEELRQAVGRLKSEKMAARHPIFGKLTHEEWTQLHLRHAELHLSFVVPG